MTAESKQPGPLAAKWAEYAKVLGHSADCVCVTAQLGRGAFYAGALAVLKGLLDPTVANGPFLQATVDDLYAFNKELQLEGMIKRAASMPVSRIPS